MSTPGATVEALRRLQESFAAASAAFGDREPQPHWAEEAELQRRFHADSPDVLDLNSLSEENLPLPEGCVCRLLCLVQQPLSTECFIGAVCREGVWETSKFRDSLPESAAAGSKTVLWSRQAYRCSLVPGATSWWQHLHQANKQQRQRCLALRECIILVYPTEGETPPKLNEVIEVIGFCWGGTDVAVHQFADSRNSCDCGEPRGLPTWGSPEGPVLLRLHAFAFRRLLSTSPERPLGHVQHQALIGAWEEHRRRAIEFLKHCFDGDAFAAEYGLLALCSSPTLQQHQQQEGGLAVHRLRIAFSMPYKAVACAATQQEQHGGHCRDGQAVLCDGSTPVVAAAVNGLAPCAAAGRQECVCPLLTSASRRLLKACRELVPCATAVSVHPEALLQHKLAPQLQLAHGDFNEDVLSAAPLQLPPGCVVVVDEPQSLERGDLQAFLRRRIAATTVAPTAAKQKEHPNRSATQKENTEPNSDDAGRKQQQQQELEMDLLQQDIGANVSALQMLITDGSVPYDFIAGIRPIATDCCILLFAHESRDSHFDSLVRVPVAAPPEAEPGDDLEKDTQKDIEGLRQLISAARECGGGVRLHPELSETAVADFVRKRQQEDDISSEDFQQWLLVAAAVAASHGSFVQRGRGTHETEDAQTSASPPPGDSGLEVLVELKHWRHAQMLEDERRRRIRVVRQQQEIQQENSRLKNEVASLVAKASGLSLT